MVAAAQYGSFTFLGLASRLVYTIDAYVSDVANANVRFDSGSGASSTSDTFWAPPEPVQLRDFAMVTGTADTTKIRLVVNGVNTPNILRYTPHLTTNPMRPPLSLVVGAGGRFAAIQLA